MSLLRLALKRMVLAPRKRENRQGELRSGGGRNCNSGYLDAFDHRPAKLVVLLHILACARNPASLRRLTPTPALFLLIGHELTSPCSKGLALIK